MKAEPLIKLSQIHPFPARMAPEIVFEHLAELSKDAVVLDPMSGSGTVLRAGSELGYSCVGFDLDPLAVLMARVWTTPVDVDEIRKAARDLINQAQSKSVDSVPWIENCRETQKYVSFWYGKKQIRQLSSLAHYLYRQDGPIADALRIALSRIIITKERGASIARDTSHSRPHRVFFNNDYDVFAGFLQSSEHLCKKLRSERLSGEVVINLGDARRLCHLPDKSIDAIITSPPYLNAIDYLRGHRLALVWFGLSVREIRSIRSGSIGTEVSEHRNELLADLDRLLAEAGDTRKLPRRELGMIHRYAIDIKNLAKEMCRVLRPGGQVVVVVGDSCLKGVRISNAAINIAAAEGEGLKLQSTHERDLPSANRYLPPPSDQNEQQLARRMRTETVLKFVA